jgi:serine/threonine protein kinase
MNELNDKKIVGSPDYIPPEVILGKSSCNKSIDLWSLGCIVYELIVGKLYDFVIFTNNLILYRNSAIS